MSKVTIIDVDLGVNIDDIITSDINTLSMETQKILDDNIDVNVAASELSKSKKIDKADEAVNVIYDKLVEIIGGTGLMSDDIMRIADGNISNISAFTLRMRAKLRNEGHKYILTKVGGCYKLLNALNESPTD